MASRELLADVVEDLFDCHPHRLYLIPRSTAHVAHTHIWGAADDVKVISLHLCKSLFEYYRPNSIVSAHLNGIRLVIHDWNVVVYDCRLGNAKSKQIDGVATRLKQIFLKNFLQPIRNLSDS